VTLSEERFSGADCRVFWDPLSPLLPRRGPLAATALLSIPTRFYLPVYGLGVSERVEEIFEDMRLQWIRTRASNSS